MESFFGNNSDHIEGSFHETRSRNTIRQEACYRYEQAKGYSDAIDKTIFYELHNGDLDRSLEEIDSIRELARERSKDIRDL